MKPPKIYYVSLKVGSREFIGEGNTRQAARHCAATKALEILRNLPLPDAEKLKALAAEKAAAEKEAEGETENNIGWGYKTFFMLNSTEHETPTAHK